MINQSAFSPSSSLLLSLFYGSSLSSHLRNSRVTGLTRTPFAPQRLAGFVPTNMDPFDWTEVPNLPSKVRVCFGVYHSEQTHYKELPGTTGLVRDADGAEGLLGSKVARGVSIIGALPPQTPYSQDYLVIEADDFITVYHQYISAYKPLSPSNYDPSRFDALSLADRISITRLAPDLIEPNLNLVPISRGSLYRTPLTTATGEVPTATKPIFGLGVSLSFGGGASASDVVVSSDADNRLQLQVGWLSFPTLPASPNVTIFGYDLQPVDANDKIFSMIPSTQSFVPVVGNMYKCFAITGLKNNGNPLSSWNYLRAFIVFAVRGPGRLVLPNGYVDYFPNVNLI